MAFVLIFGGVFTVIALLSMAKGASGEPTAKQFNTAVKFMDTIGKMPNVPSGVPRSVFDACSTQVFNISVAGGNAFLSNEATLEVANELGLAYEFGQHKCKSLNIWDSGANRTLCTSLKYAVKGTVRSNDGSTRISTANGITLPEKIFTAKIPVKVPTTGETRFVVRENCMLVPSCPHNLYPAGVMAQEHGIATYIAPWGETSYIRFSDGAKVPLINTGILILPDASSVTMPAVSNGDHGFHKDLTAEDIHNTWNHRAGEALAHLPKVTDMPNKVTEMMKEYIKECPGCEACLEGSSKNISSSHHLPVFTEPGQCVSIDTWTCNVGHRHGGQRKCIRFKDIYSRFGKSYLMRSESESGDKLKLFHAWAKSTGRTVLRYNFDNASVHVGEHNANTLRNICKTLEPSGVHWTSISPRNPR